MIRVPLLAEPFSMGMSWFSTGAAKIVTSSGSNQYTILISAVIDLGLAENQKSFRMIGSLRNDLKNVIVCT